MDGSSIEHSTETINLICNLLQLNLKLFQDLFRYKHAFNSFQADLNTHLTTIANHQQQQQQIDDEEEEEGDDNTRIGNGKKHKMIELQRTKQKLSDLIIEKFVQTCSDLGQPDLDGGCNYESSIYSILAIVDEFNNSDMGDSGFLSNDDLMDPNDSELKSHSKQIDSFLSKLNSDPKFRIKLLDKLFKKLVDSFDNDYDANGNIMIIDNDHQNGDQDDNEAQKTIEQQQLIPQYQCKFCLKTFEQISFLINHQREEHRSRFGCARCKQTFRNEYVMRIHLRKDNCYQLNKSVDLDSSQKSLLSSISSAPKIAIINSISTTATTMPTNMIILPKNQTQSIQFPQQQQQQNPAQPRNHICKWPGCGKTFTRVSYLSNHMMAHSDERNFACDQPGCQKRYKTQAHLLNHMVIHKKYLESIKQLEQNQLEIKENGQEKQCPWKNCKEKFPNEQEMLNHFHQSHFNNLQPSNDSKQSISLLPSTADNGKINNNDDTIFKCEYSGCDFKAEKSSELQQHISIKHTGGSLQFQCEYCGTTFTKKSSLSNHVKSHSGQFTCSWHNCTFRSHSSVVLSRHMMSHKDYITTNNPNKTSDNNQKQQQQQQQQQESKQQKPSSQQLISQQPEESYTCKLCSKTFNKRASIINHVRSHSGQYSCQWPGCYFASQSKMLYRRHVVSANHDLDEPQSQISSSFTSQSESSEQSFIKMEDEEQQQQSASIISNLNESSNMEDNNGNSSNTTSQDDQQSEEKAMRIFHCRYPNCLYRTHKRPLYRVHMLKHSEIRKHRCFWPNCDKKFKAKSTLNRHVLRHRQMEASQNGLVTIKMNDYDHEEETIDDNAVNEEEDNFEDQEDQQQQIINESNNQNNEISMETENGNSFDCSTQSQSSTDNSSLKPFKCDQCGVSFRTKSALTNHLTSHRKPQFRCRYPGCFYETFRQLILERHIQDEHNPNKKRDASNSNSNKIYCCSKITCQKTFDNGDDLHQHILMHKNQTKFRCFWPECKKEFTNRSSFTEHIQSHKKPTKYRCTGQKNCTKSFNTKQELCDHLMMHKTEKKFQCTWDGCSYSSNLSSNLKKHLYRHQRKAIEEQLVAMTMANNNRRTVQNNNNNNDDVEQEEDNNNDDDSNSRTENFISMPFVASISSV